MICSQFIVGGCEGLLKFPELSAAPAIHVLERRSRGTRSKEAVPVGVRAKELARGSEEVALGLNQAVRTFGITPTRKIVKMWNHGTHRNLNYLGSQKYFSHCSLGGGSALSHPSYSFLATRHS